MKLLQEAEFEHNGKTFIIQLYLDDELGICSQVLLNGRPVDRDCTIGASGDVTWSYHRDQKKPINQFLIDLMKDEIRLQYPAN